MTKREFKYCKAQRLDVIKYIYVWKNCKDLYTSKRKELFKYDVIQDYRFIHIDTNRPVNIIGEYIHFYSRTYGYVKSCKFIIHRKFIQKLE